MASTQRVAPIARGYHYALELTVAPDEAGPFAAGAVIVAQVRAYAGGALAGQLSTADGSLYRVDDNRLELQLPATVTAALPGSQAVIDLVRTDEGEPDWLDIGLRLPAIVPVTELGLAMPVGAGEPAVLGVGIVTSELTITLTRCAERFGAGPVTIAPATIASSAQVFTPTLAPPAAGGITAPLIGSTAAVPSPALAPVAAGGITPPIIASTAQVFAPAVSVSGGGTIGTPLIASTASVLAPTLGAAGQGSTTAPLIASTASTFAPTLGAEPVGTIGAPLIDSTASVMAPTVSSISAEAISAPLIGSSATVIAPALTAVAPGAISAPLIGSTAQVLAPNFTASATQAGYYPNGASNTAVKSAIARVKNGTGRARMLFKGDSTTVGQGGGTNADPHFMTNARPNRPPAQLATLLTNAGIPALDGSFVGDCGMAVNNLGSVSIYDTRVALNDGGAGSNWSVAADQTFAAAGFFENPQYGLLALHPTVSVDTFEMVLYNAQNATAYFAIDGSNPTFGPSSTAISTGTGFTKVTLTGGSVGTHVGQIGGDGTHTNNLAFCSATAYDSTQRAFDILVDAACGATSANQAATGNGWKNLDHIGFVAPDLTIVNLGINDMTSGVSTSAYTANLQSIITAALASGNVLLVFPHAIDPARVDDATQATYAAAAKALAASAGVGFFNLREALGSYATISAHLVDGVHGDATFYGWVASAYQNAITAMAA